MSASKGALSSEQAPFSAVDGASTRDKAASTSDKAAVSSSKVSRSSRKVSWIDEKVTWIAEQAPFSDEGDTFSSVEGTLSAVQVTLIDDKAAPSDEEDTLLEDKAALSDEQVSFSPSEVRPMTTAARASRVKVVPIWCWLPLLVCISACTEPNGALGKVLFTYDCSNGGPTPNDDAWCDTGPDSSVMPTVAVGARFTILSDPQALVAPAVTDLVETSQDGTQWALVQPGWLGVLAMRGVTVLDYTHIRGLNVGTIALSLASSSRSLLSDFTFFSGLGEGVIGSVVVTPMADNGALLAGAIPCTFSSSSTAVTVDGAGRVANLTASTSGDATITADCLGTQAQVTIHVSIALPVGSADARAMTDVTDENARDNVIDVAKESANDDVTYAPNDGSRDAPADAGTEVDSEAGISDAVDSRSPADAEGG